MQATDSFVLLRRMILIDDIFVNRGCLALDPTSHESIRFPTGRLSMRFRRCNIHPIEIA